MAVLVDLDAVTVHHADRALFERCSLTVRDGDRLGIVGINGTGKTSLLQVLAGQRPPDGGDVRRGRGARVRYLDQDPVLPGARVGDVVGSAWQVAAFLERLGGSLDPSRSLSSLSGGEAKRLALARVLAEEGELLVLDEPTNHLDLQAIDWLGRHLVGLTTAVVLVSHDRHVLDLVTTRVVELDRWRAYVHEGGYAAYLEGRAEREERAASSEAVRRNLARHELAWLRRGARARTRKPQARLDAARRLVGGRPEAAAREGVLDLGFSTPRLGDKVLECRGVGYRHDPGGAPVLSGVDLLLAPGERVGLVGRNGSGKSTLLDLLAGRRAPSQGAVERGPTVAVGYYDQRGVTLDPSARVQDLVAGPTRVPGGPEDVALMGRFWFTGELALARVGTLSGGERRRLQLLLVLAARPNVLLLDEPTNDLDLDTLRSLEDLLDAWPGTLVVASHDRTFLERSTDRLVAIEDAVLAGVPGGVPGWLARLGGDAGEPGGPARRGGGTAAAGAAPGAAPRRPSTSTFAHRLRTLERELDRLSRGRDDLAAALAGAQGHEALAEAGSALAAVQADLEATEARWLALAEEAEASRPSR